MKDNTTILCNLKYIISFDMKTHRMIIGISGASGAIYAQRFMEKINALDGMEVHVVFSDTARKIWTTELGAGTDGPQEFTYYDVHNFYAPFASGSSRFDSMVVIPASMGCMGRIASGVADDLITRAADVMLKENRKLILVPRETPLNLVHLKNMETLIQAGATICPANPSFYSKPTTVEKVVDTVVDRIIDLLGFDHNAFRWGED
jgi:4-hydroxy-3-polyprenylbenzoate decarboxylase